MCVDGPAGLIVCPFFFGFEGGRCSGDGTMRKNIQIWNKWSPVDGNGLHA